MPNVKTVLDTFNIEVWLIFLIMLFPLCLHWKQALYWSLCEKNEENVMGFSWIIFMGNLGMSWDFFSKVPSTLDTKYDCNKEIIIIIIIIIGNTGLMSSGG